MWSLFTKKGEAMPPRTFSNDKTQEDAIDEIIKIFKDNDVVFLQGAVGSGKSIIGASVAGYFGSGIISVPLKPLQEQYLKDFTERFQIVLGKPLEIKILKGRSNFQCAYKNSKASDRMLPCTKKLRKIRDEDGKVATESRWQTAKKCACWSPIYRFSPSEKMRKELKPVLIREYINALGETNYHIVREKGCGYYQQNSYYENSGVLVYNSAKWIADVMLGRKPKVNIEIFDEADSFLDSLVLKTSITGKRITFLENLRRAEEDEDTRKLLDSLLLDVKEGFEKIIKSAPDAPHDAKEEHIQFLKNLQSLVKHLNDERLEDFEVRLSRLLQFSEMLIFYTGALSITFFIPRPDVVLRDYLSKSAKKILFMSATLQSSSVLREVYDFTDFGYVIGEPNMPGRIIPKKVGGEGYVTYRSWKDETFRNRYFSAFSKILEKATRPTLVQIHAYKYLPEKDWYPLLPTQEHLKNLSQDEEIEDFKLGSSDILFSTKTDRGIDLPDEKCRSIVLQKYPYPHRYDPMLVALEKRLGKAFDKYYEDLAWRNFVQQIGRGLRHPKDWVEVWSPDSIVHSNLKKVLALAKSQS